MSDVYFTEGAALGPESFGQTIDNGTWAPLASATIATNITSAGGYGTNGFYLPFDPAAVGKNYSSGTTVTGTLTSGNAGVLFNGDLSDDQSVGTTSDTTQITFTFSPALPAGELGLFVDSSEVNLEVNGVDKGNVGSSPKVVTIGTIADPITSIAITGGGAASGVGTFIRGIYIDGKLLVDHNNIGVDDSGNNNDFYDENFAVGNTSQVWSANMPANFGQTSYPARYAFNYDKFSLVGLSVNAISAPKFAYIAVGQTCVIPINLPVTSTFGLVTGLESTTTITAIGNASDGSTVDLSSQLQNTSSIMEAIDSSFAGKTLTSISISADGGGLYVAGFFVDGAYLIDANIQDTVLDKPVSSYAVIDPARTGTVSNAQISNGNLVFTTDGTASAYPASYATQGMASPSGKYYWETTFTKGSNYLIGIGNSSAQPDTYIGFDSNSLGYYSNGTVYPAGATYGQTFGIGDVIGTTWDSDAGVITWYKNGVSQGPINYSGGQTMYPGVSKGSDPEVGIMINLGQQPFAYATNNSNGTATVNGEVYQLLVEDITVSQVGSGDLYYDENYSRVLSSLQMANKYGVPARVDSKRGIYALSEQPTFPVLNYTKVGNVYQPNRDYLPEVQRLRRILLKAACAFQASHAIAVGDVIYEGGVFYEAVTAHNTGSSFNAADGNWRVITIDEDPATTY